MIKNYFKIALRNIIRHKAYAAINISGLTVGIAACLLIFVVIQYETSFEKFQPNHKNVYHLVTQQERKDGITYTPGVPYPSAPALRLDFPQAKVGTLFSSYGSQLTVPGNDAGNAAGDKKFIEPIGVFFGEPEFFGILKSVWLSGKPDVLKDPDMLVLDKSTATKYFGDWKNAIGKTVRMDNVLTLKVAGIIEDAPSNSDFPLKVVVSYIDLVQHPKEYGYQADWNGITSNLQVFMEFPANTSVPQTNLQLKAFAQKHASSKRAVVEFPFLQPLDEMHFDARVGNQFGDHLTTKTTLRTLSFIAILIIIMASINFINLSTAQSVGRSKKVGIRKVLGSSRKQLITQVLGETTVVVIIAVILALAVAKLSMPFLKNIASVPDSISLLNSGSLLFLLVVMVSVILLSGVYPALVVSGFKPVLALKNKITAASIGGISLRRSLVVGQFAISQLLIIGTIVAVNQMDFVSKADLGFDKNAVLILPGYTDSISLQKMQSFKQELLQNPAVIAASFTSDAPSSENNWATNFFFNHSTKDLGFPVFLKMADADYFKTFGLRFAAGKGYDQSDTLREAVINTTMLKKLGMQNANEAIGKTIALGNKQFVPIVGVLEDFKTNSLRETVKPMMIYPRKGMESEVAAKIKTQDLAGTVATIRKEWEKMYPEYAYSGFFLDDNIAKFYKQENQMALVYKIFASIAIFISCLGLYGLVSFMVVQRTKEVGVRKVLGASVGNIVFLLSKEFLVLISISFVIAMPVGWYVMSGWLENFAYKITLNVWVFIIAIMASVIIAGVTVSFKAVKAALVNPVRSLKSGE